MKLTATEMDELARMARDFSHGVREQLNREDDVKAERSMGRLMRATRGIAAGLLAWCGILAVYAVLAFMLSGCGNTAAEDRYAAMVAAVEASETADLQCQCKSGGECSCEDCQCREQCEMSVEVRAREPADPRFADCPSPCVIKIGATWCGPCQTEPITAWLKASDWTVHHYDYDRDTAFANTLGVRVLPTFIVIRDGREVARYEGADINGFLPILKAACQ